MSQTIKCLNCGQVIEITEALRQEIEVKLKKEISAQARVEAIKKVREEYNAKIQTTKEESAHTAKQNNQLQEEIKKLFSQLREANETKSKLAIHYQKKLLEEEENIRKKTRLETEEELSLKIAQKDKQLQDAEKQVKELQRKIQQGSQQLQGEVQELKLEEILKQKFIFDEIKEVPKGIKGADIIQTVKTNSGIFCGTIVWESKNTKNWSQAWIAKLKEDQRNLKAELAVLVSSVLPENISGFGFWEGVWISDFKSLISLAWALRQQLVKIQNIKQAYQGKASKTEIVYNYLLSTEFKQRIEVWVEYFKNRQEELTKEKAYFAKKWEKEEKNIGKLLQNTAGIYGDLQGLIGNALPKVGYLELADNSDNNSSSNS